MTTRTWTGLAGDGLWDTPGNWSGGAVPTSADDVVIGGSSTISFDDAIRSVHNCDASGFTGSLTSGGLMVTGTSAQFGNCALNTGNGLHINSSSAVTLTCGPSCVIDWLRVYGSGGLILGSDVYAQSLTISPCPINVGAFKLKTDGLDVSNGAATWTWSTGGQLVVTAGGNATSAVAQQTPSLPPFVITNGFTLTGGDITVYRILAESGSIVLNGNRIIETNPPIPPALTVAAAQAQTLSALEAAINAILSPLTDTSLTYIDIAAFVDDRRTGVDLRALVSTTDQGATLATPFVVKTFFAPALSSDDDTLTTLVAQVQAFISAHTSYFISAVRLLFFDVDAHGPQCIAWLVYNTTSGASANFLFK